MPSSTDQKSGMTYEEFVEEAGRDFAEETFRMAELHAAGKINDWEVWEIEKLVAGSNVNGQPHRDIVNEQSRAVS